MENNHICPKCNSNMVEGTLRSHKSYYPIQWKEKVPYTLANILNNVLKRLPKVLAYKCINCGYLEQYVEEEKKTDIPTIL